MRGKASMLMPFVFFNRITPAYAGKREPVFFGDGVFQDHPRLCGEKTKAVMSVDGAVRITPAYAGKSNSNPATYRGD